MARAATNADVFNALAEPRRRQILALVTDRERPVGDLVDEVGLAQPAVSKHLRVLRDVGAVTVRTSGRERYYRLDASALNPIRDWLGGIELLWSKRLDRLQAVLTDAQRGGDGDGA